MATQVVSPGLEFGTPPLWHRFEGDSDDIQGRLPCSRGRWFSEPPDGYCETTLRREVSMYVGIGTVLLIILIVLLIMFVF